MRFRRQRARRPRLVQYDARTLLRCNVADLAQCIRGPSDVTAWFGVDTDRETKSMTLGTGRRRVSLAEIHETWLPSSNTLLATAMLPQGGELRGHVTLREAVVRHRLGLGTGTEVWLHIEAPATRTALELLAFVSRIVEQSFRRIEAEFDAGVARLRPFGGAD